MGTGTSECQELPQRLRARTPQKGRPALKKESEWVSVGLLSHSKLQQHHASNEASPGSALPKPCGRLGPSELRSLGQSRPPGLAPASCPQHRLLSHPARPVRAARRRGQRPASGPPGEQPLPTCRGLGAGPACPGRLLAAVRAPPASRSPRPTPAPSERASTGPAPRWAPRGVSTSIRPRPRAGPSLGEGDTGHPVVDTAALLAEQTELLQGGVLPRVLIGVLRGERGGQPCWPLAAGRAGATRGGRHSPK